MTIVSSHFFYALLFQPKMLTTTQSKISTHNTQIRIIAPLHTWNASNAWNECVGAVGVVCCSRMLPCTSYVSMHTLI